MNYFFLAFGIRWINHASSCAPVLGEHLLERLDCMGICFPHCPTFTKALKIFAPVSGNPKMTAAFDAREDESIARVVAYKQRRFLVGYDTLAEPGIFQRYG